MMTHNDCSQSLFKSGGGPLASKAFRTHSLLKFATLLGAVALLGAARIDTPLADAAMRGDLARVRALLESRADVNAPQGDGMTALHWAAEKGNLAIAQALLRAKADVGLTTRLGGYTALHLASRQGNATLVKALLDAGANPNTPANSGATALHLAATAGDSASVSALLARGAEINAREREWGQTPLMFAAASNRAAAVSVLLKHNADPTLLSKTLDLGEEEKREQAAIRKRNEVLLSYLPPRVQDSIKKAANPRAAQALPGGATPPAPTAGGVPIRVSLEAPPTATLSATQVQQAIAAGREALKTGAPTTMVAEAADTSDGQVFGFAGSVGKMGGLTALHHAVRQGNTAAALALIDGGAPINAPASSDSTTPLLMAVLNGHFDLAMQLVSRGANVKMASIVGMTPLYAALNTQWAPRSRYPQPQSVQYQRTSHIELMEKLLAAGADPNVRLKKHPWFFAYNNCGNANCGLENLEGTTPFWRAAYAVDVEAMRLLKAHGADHTLPSTRAIVPRFRGRPATGAPNDSVARALAATPRDSLARPATPPPADSSTRRLAAGAASRDSTQPRQAPNADRPFANGNFDTGNGPLTPAMDSAARATAPGLGVYPIHAAAGVGYGNGFAGNSHRHAPDGWMPSLKYLVEELAADVNARDNQGYTPLHHAAARGDNEMILYLVSKGADVKAVARNGRTTVDMANGPVQRLRPFPETIALLEKLGAKNNHRCVSC